MFKRLYDWTISLAESRHATSALAGIAFAESSFFPLPPDLILLPMSLAKPKKAWFYAGVCTVASVLGGMLGYAIGARCSTRSAIGSSSSTAMARA